MLGTSLKHVKSKVPVLIENKELCSLLPSLSVVVQVYSQEDRHGMGSHPQQTTLEKKLGTETSEAILQAIGEKQQLQRN